MLGSVGSGDRPTVLPNLGWCKRPCPSGTAHGVLGIRIDDGMLSRVTKSTVRIRPADPREGERLRGIAIASKGHWGYERDRVRRWAAAGDFSPAGLGTKEVFVAEIDGQAVAWAAMIPQGDVCRLEDLWVEPASIGTGIGTQLFVHCVERARELGATRLEWEAEPNAIGFYERMGARHLRDGPLSSWGRTLSIMGIDLETDS
jgi:GNAT superfamily N-acetyltransferase